MMKPYLMALAVGLGGAIGSLLRYWIGKWSSVVLGGGYPWGTLMANFLGCLAMGVAVVLVYQKLQGGAELLRHFLMIGLLGGLTTFSTFILDTSLLWDRGWMVAMSYVGVSFLGCLMGLLLGFWLGRLSLGA